MLADVDSLSRVAMSPRGYSGMDISIYFPTFDDMELVGASVTSVSVLISSLAF